MATTAQAKLAAGKRTGQPWAVAVNINATGNEILVAEFPDSFIMVPEVIDDAVLGRSTVTNVLAGNRVSEPVVIAPMRWESRLWTLFSIIMGAENVTTIGTGPTLQQVHQFILSVTQGAFPWVTMCLNDGLVVREAESYQPSTLLITGESGGFLTMEVNGIASNVLIAGQTNPSIALATPLSTLQLITFGCTGILMNDRDAGALVSPTDLVNFVNTYTIGITRPVESQFSAQNIPCDGVTEWMPSQPVQTSFTEGEITLDFNEYTDTDFLEAVQLGSRKKMVFQIDGEIYDAVNSLRFKLKLWFPDVLVTELTHSGAAGEQIVQSATLRMIHDDTPHVSFPQVASAFVAELTDRTPLAYGAIQI